MKLKTYTHKDPVQLLATRSLWAIIGLHVLVWTLIPSVFRYALPMDAAEGAVWGQRLMLGYDRNPWLNGWLTRLALELGGGSDWIVYLFSQLCVGLALWAIWQLARKILAPLPAVVAVLMLEAVQYYTLAAVDFNDNVLELALWPLLILAFYNAVTVQRLGDWLWVAIMAGLAMMAKYYAALLLLPLLIFLCYDPKARQSFKQPGIYLAILLFALILLPHLLWLFHHDFITARYALGRVSEQSQPGFWSYLQPGLKFSVMQLLSFSGAVVLLSVIFWGKNSSLALTRPYSQDDFKRRFLWIVGVGPYGLTVGLSLILGWQLHTLWGMPLLSCWSILLLYYLQPTISGMQFRRFLVAVIVVFVALAGGYTFSLLQPSNTVSANFPARLFAEEITAIWHTYRTEPLPYVGGDRVLASYVSRYSADRPRAYLGWQTLYNPWINEDAMRGSGAIFLQPLAEGKTFPAEVLARFPGLKVVEIHSIAYARARPDAKPLSILVGLLPASSS